MNKKLLSKSFNWRMLLMRILVNMLALMFTVLITPTITFISPSVRDWFLMAIGLGLITAIVKPIIQFLTLRFIFATGGLVIVVINTVLLYLLQWLFPDRFSVTNFWWAIFGGLALGLSSTILESLLGLSPPIVSEKYPELRQRVKDRQFYRTQNELYRVEAIKKTPARELSTAKTLVAGSDPAVAKLFNQDKDLDDMLPPEAPPVELHTTPSLNQQILALTESATEAATPPVAGAPDIAPLDPNAPEQAAAPDENPKPVPQPAAPKGQED